MTNSNQLTIKSMLPAGFSNVSAGKTYVGIDFGTSTTVVSIASFDLINNKLNIEAIRLDQLLEDGTRYQSEKIPSVIAWYKNKLLVGEGASNLKYILRKGKNIWFSFKMEIGEDLGAKYYDSEVADIDILKIRNPKDCVRVFFMYLQMLILRYCKNKGLSDNIKYAISIPASFEANQRKELMEALETNGMIVSKQSLIDEPNAAFISYVNESQESEKPLVISELYNPKVLVFDFGGGTCDISILEIGKSANGLYSKNVAISKFTKLGGDDIDRYLTYHYLLPRFLEYNSLTIDKFRTQELKEIATKLYKVAESLKIRICKSISILSQDFTIPSIKNSENKNSLSTPISIATTKGELRQEDFYLTNKELSEAMQVFMRNSRIPTKIRGQEDYCNIFMPIKSAIDKAKIAESELDFILLIGGSAQNPFVQEALHSYFSESEMLIPGNLQTHVSKGAAIHSLLMNGMGKCIIQPITSEPIILITKDTTNKVLIPAGMTIPCDTVIIDDLQPSRDQQDAIELPLCVGNPNKMLQNLKITRPNGLKFPMDSTVTLTLEVTADKVLLAQAECMGIKLMIEPQNPFSNGELTSEERIILVAERQANLEAESNGGIPSKSSLIRLTKAYERVGNDFKVAETMELQNDLYPNPNDFNIIGVYYHNSGNKAKAVDFFERALQYNPNSFWPNFNLGNTLFYNDRKRSLQYLEKAYSIDSNEPCVNILLAQEAQREGQTENAKEKFEKAYNIYSEREKRNSLDQSDYGWYASAAEGAEMPQEAVRIRRKRPTFVQEKFYNDENLTMSKIHLVTK